MSLRDQLDQEMQDAIRSGDRVRKDTLRMAVSAIRLVELEKGSRLDDAETMAALQKEIKQRHEAISDAEKARRPDLVEEARAEIQVLQSFLPDQLSEGELIALAQEAITEVSEETGSSPTLKEMGAVMKKLMPKLQGRAPGQKASQIVRSLLESAPPVEVSGQAE